MRRATLSDVAREAEVSPITVSRALRKPESVSEKLRERIIVAVQSLAYVPDLAASRLASSRTHLVGVIVPTLYNTIFAEYLLAIHEMLIEAGFQIVVVNSRYSESEEEAAIKTLIGQRVEAIVVAGVRHTPLARTLLLQSHVPVIETFDLAEDPVGINIGLSQMKAATVATQHLIGLGHRRVSILAGNLDERAMARLSGYRRAMEEAGLETQIEIVTPVIELKKNQIIRRGVELGAPLHLTWSCYQNDDLACGVCDSCLLRLKAFEEAGMPDPIPYRRATAVR